MLSLMVELSPYIWTGIFKVLEVLVVGLILGLFATKYQKRKEVELKVKSNILLRRLEALEKVHKINCELYSFIAPNLEEQGFINEYIDGTRFPVLNIEYRRCMTSQVDFDDYYKRLSQLIQFESIYFDYDIKEKLSEYLNYLSEIKMIMDAYYDVEQADVYKVDFAFKVLGVALQLDFNRFYGLIDQSIAKQLRSISLSYKDQYFKGGIKKAHYNFALYLEKYLKDEGWKGNLSRKIYYGYVYKHYGKSVLLNYIGDVHNVLRYIHYSDTYSVKDFDNLPDDKIKDLIVEFNNQFILNYHV